jgi:hypothetical protein
LESAAAKRRAGMCHMGMLRSSPVMVTGAVLVV